MDAQNLQENYPRLLSYMKENGYSTFYVRRFESVIKHILLEVKLHGWSTYEDVYHAWVKKYKSESTLTDKRKIIGIIKRFDLENIFPNSITRTNFLKTSSYELLPEEYKKVIDTYRKVAKQSGKKEDTVYAESNNATTFLLSLHQKGMDLFEKVTSHGVLEFFFKDGLFIRGYSYKKNISTVLKTCVPFFPENTCDRILSFLPALRDKRRNIQYLTGEEIAGIKAVLTGDRSSLSFRNKAIGLLALYLGLRCCDIAGLELADIDWTNDLLHIRQQKTGVPLQLPLKAIIGNAIYDYLMQERPDIQCKKLFISMNHPMSKLQGSSMYHVAKKIMEAANIRANLGDRQGFHLFRHHLAITLLENEVSQPVISTIMGHLSPASVEPYLNADFQHLKGCALSIGCFPLRKEVLL